MKCCLCRVVQFYQARHPFPTHFELQKSRTNIAPTNIGLADSAFPITPSNLHRWRVGCCSAFPMLGPAWQGNSPDIFNDPLQQTAYVVLQGVLLVALVSRFVALMYHNYGVARVTSPKSRLFPGGAHKGSSQRVKLQVTCLSNPSHSRNLPVNLPGGGGVWLGSSSTDFLYGQSYGFVIKRDKVGGEGLIVFRKPPKPQHVKQEQRRSPLAPQPKEPSGGLSLVGLDIASCSVVIDTDYEILQPSPEIQPNTTCTGLVLISTGEEEEHPAPEASKHPRRTRKVSFTCNLCGCSNLKETNPHAWRSGSVFMRCEGCSAVHKMKDNLNIFHELKGSVFPPRHMRNSFLVQEILDKIQAKRAQQSSGDDDVSN